MTKVMTAIFSDSKKAGNAVAELNEKGYTKDISVVAKNDVSMDADTHDIKQDVSDGAAAGAATGATMGGLAGLLVGAASFIVPGLGLVVLGPLATILSGAAAGALTGGITGAMVDWGIPDDKAHDYERRIQNGEVLVAVTGESSKESNIVALLTKHGATEISPMHSE